MALSIKDGYVFYERGATSDSPYWYWVYQQGVNEARNIESLYSNTLNSYKQAGQRLINLGRQEREKEKNLIRRAIGFTVNDDEDIKEFVRKFNEVLIGKKQFKAAVERLNSALSKDKQERNFRAPTISSFYTSYLETALSQELSNFISKNRGKLLNEDFSTWDANFDKIVDRAIRKSLQRMLTEVEKVEGKELYGEGETWKEVYEATRLIEGFDNYFSEMIRSKIDFNQLKKEFKKGQFNFQKGKRSGARKGIEKALNLTGRKSRSIGGSVQEFAQNAMEELGEAVQNSKHGHIVFRGEIMATDNVSMYSYSTEFDTNEQVQSVLRELSQQLASSTSLMSTVRRMEEFYNNNLSKLDDSFIVYGSTKSYSMSESFGGFHKGGEQSLENAVYYLEQAGIGNKEKVENLIHAAYNTADGAILSDKREFFTEQLKSGIMSAIAELLFDDWISLGEYKRGTTAIHVLQLEGLELPLSILLIATGKAMMSTAEDMERLVKVKITLPDSVIEEYKDNPIQIPNGMSGQTAKDFMLDKWNEQAELAKQQSTFSVGFLSNFKTIIKQWI